jgi:hypothetical protein
MYSTAPTFAEVAASLLHEVTNVLVIAQTGVAMSFTLSIGPLISLIAGILILIVPKLLNYIVAVYLIVIGLLGLFGAAGMHLR